MEMCSKCKSKNVDEKVHSIPHFDRSRFDKSGVKAPLWEYRYTYTCKDCGHMWQKITEDRE